MILGKVGYEGGMLSRLNPDGLLWVPTRFDAPFVVNPNLTLGIKLDRIRRLTGIKERLKDLCGEDM